MISKNKELEAEALKKIREESNFKFNTQAKRRTRFKTKLM
jgi:hypothetical protein